MCIWLVGWVGFGWVGMCGVFVGGFLWRFFVGFFVGVLFGCFISRFHVITGVRS